MTNDIRSGEAECNHLVQLSGQFNKLVELASNLIEKIPGFLLRPWIIGFFLSVLAISYMSALYKNFDQTLPSWYIKAFEWQVAHPLQAIPISSFISISDFDGRAEHLEKQTYRIALPLFAKLIGVSSFGGLVIIQRVTSFLFLMMTFMLLKRFFRDVPAALFGALAIACSSVGGWGFQSVEFFDGVAYFLLLSCVFTKNPFLITFILMLAGFVDERAIAASPLIYFCWMKKNYYTITLHDFLSLNPQRIGILAGILLFIVARYCLSLWMGCPLVLRAGLFVDASKALEHFKMLPFASLFFLKGSCIAILVGFALLYIRSGLLLIFTLLISMIPLIAGVCMVADFERSFGYVFPLIFFSYKLIGESLPQSVLRGITFASAVFSLLIPNVSFLFEVHAVIPIYSLIHWNLEGGI
ncbi:MAG: hypothetical protein ACD_44C00349G0002 [uncultured bacterium]|nr:MAG: hypothetical protein ACD_44C00349G0002 [uncultured bacterium]